ncbi:excisionase family DNA binding protein [Saccharothrix tamanrassetensis]|uniref:Excisionase family DNA binding protein n=1 Tax=Saccharothrix tamanrassetensis TaxID=1051531 RepID=A0A841CFF7_9PSEU|nr:helix-turn-helix domain-containing protein [Saccharothrix tamanrassetensis]MBB5954446.1 excisionase family DNA binding protein [Saccharothrix tamanrassetensis]
MTTIVGERTLLPPARPESSSALAALLAGLRQDKAILVAPDGSRLELPAEVFEVIRDVVQAMSQGLAITVAPRHTVLTTSEAAQVLGVSRPTLVRLLEAGEIPYEKPNRHRRVLLADLLAYQERVRRARAAGLDQMVRDGEESGLYDLPIDTPFERMPPDDDR